jgi:hypothetical protein
VLCGMHLRNKKCIFSSGLFIMNFIFCIFKKIHNTIITRILFVQNPLRKCPHTEVFVSLRLLFPFRKMQQSNPHSITPFQSHIAKSKSILTARSATNRPNKPTRPLLLRLHLAFFAAPALTNFLPFLFTRGIELHRYTLQAIAPLLFLCLANALH